MPATKTKPAPSAAPAGKAKRWPHCQHHQYDEATGVRGPLDCKQPTVGDSRYCREHRAESRLRFGGMLEVWRERKRLQEAEAQAAAAAATKQRRRKATA